MSFVVFRCSESQSSHHSRIVMRLKISPPRDITTSVFKRVALIIHWKGMSVCVYTRQSRIKGRRAEGDATITGDIRQDKGCAEYISPAWWHYYGYAHEYITQDNTARILLHWRKWWITKRTHGQGVIGIPCWAMYGSGTPKKPMGLRTSPLPINDCTESARD